MTASWSKTIQSVLACGPRVLFLPTKQSARPIYSHDNATWSERAEARDREQRQKNKITQLEKILNTHVESIDKTSDMACTMLKSIDAKTTTVLSDLKKAGSAVRSASTSTPGTNARMCMHTPDTHVKRGTTTTATSDSDTSQSMQSDGVTTHSAGRATTESVSPASQRKKSATVACAPTTTKPAPPRPHAVEPIAPDDDDDKLWSLMLKAKPTGKKSVLYIGNLEENASEEKLREYVEKRSQKPVSVSQKFSTARSSAEKREN